MIVRVLFRTAVRHNPPCSRGEMLGPPNANLSDKEKERHDPANTPCAVVKIYSSRIYGYRVSKAPTGFDMQAVVFATEACPSLTLVLMYSADVLHAPGEQHVHAFQIFVGHLLPHQGLPHHARQIEPDVFLRSAPPAETHVYRAPH